MRDSHSSRYTLYPPSPQPEETNAIRADGLSSRSITPNGKLSILPYLFLYCSKSVSQHDFNAIKKIGLSHSPTRAKATDISSTYCETQEKVGKTARRRHIRRSVPKSRTLACVTYSPNSTSNSICELGNNVQSPTESTPDLICKIHKSSQSLSTP